MFQPGAQRRRNHGPGRRPSELELRLVLALPSGALPGEQRAHHGAARPLDEREAVARAMRSEEHTSELQSHSDLVCRLLLEKKKKAKKITHAYPDRRL